MRVHIIFIESIPDASCVATKGILLPQAAPAPGLSGGTRCGFLLWRQI